jgi:hypothetical protein
LRLWSLSSRPWDTSRLLIWRMLRSNADKIYLSESLDQPFVLFTCWRNSPPHDKTGTFVIFWVQGRLLKGILLLYLNCITIHWFGTPLTCISLLFLLHRVKWELGEYITKWYRCSERLRVEAGGGEFLVHTRWSGGLGYLRRGKWIRDERFIFYWFNLSSL